MLQAHALMNTMKVLSIFLKTSLEMKIKGNQLNDTNRLVFGNINIFIIATIFF